MNIKELIENLNNKGYHTDYYEIKNKPWLRIYSLKGDQLLYKFQVPDGFEINKIMNPCNDVIIIPEIICKYFKSPDELPKLYGLNKLISELTSIHESYGGIQFRFTAEYVSFSGMVELELIYEVKIGDLEWQAWHPSYVMAPFYDEKFRELVRDYYIRRYKVWGYKLLDDVIIRDYVLENPNLIEAYPEVYADSINKYTPINENNIIRFNNGIYRVANMDGNKDKWICICSEINDRDLDIEVIESHIEVN